MPREGTACAKGLWQERKAIRRVVQLGKGLFHTCTFPLSQYIMAFAVKVLTGQVRELKDVREFDVAELPSRKPSKAE